MGNARKTTTGKIPSPAAKKSAASGLSGGKPGEPKGFRHAVKLGDAVVTFKEGAARTIVEPNGPVKLGMLGQRPGD